MVGQEVAEPVVGPFTDLAQRAVDIVSANTPGDLRPQALVLMVIIAILLFVVRGGRGAKGADGRERKTGLLNYLVPTEIYTHKSARVDVSLWVFERLLRPFWAVSLLGTVGAFSERTAIGAMQGIFGATPALESNYAWMVVFSLAMFLAYDFGFFWIHYTVHKVPFFWAMHKIHHSAEVLTPLTRTREHFLSGPLWGTASSLTIGLVTGVFAWLFDGGITSATIFNVAIFSVLFGFNGMFRHYHVGFHYPVWLSKWLQSPAMHHVHHSYLKKHWDMNNAAFTSIWDRMAGTLYIPEPDEWTPWGIGPKTQAQYRGFWQNTTGPFRDWYKMATRGKSPKVMDYGDFEKAGTSIGSQEPR